MVEKILGRCRWRKMMECERRRGYKFVGNLIVELC
jgi:hypothetical protein